MRKQSGFTLVELVTVVILLGIVTAVTAPSFFGNLPFSERGYADELAGALRHAQRVAIASDCHVQFSITPAGYSALQRNTLNTCRTASAWNRPVMRADGRPLIGAPPTGVAATPVVLEFTNLGRLTINAPPIVVGAFTLTVDPATGLVTVQ